jgi:hypothetical protein
MASVDKRKIAMDAIKGLPGLVRATGTYSAASAKRPACWFAEIGPWRMNLAERVLLSPEDLALSSLLDVWSGSGGKVFPASWMPDRPWLPPRLVKCTPGAWQELLPDAGSPAERPG